MTTVVLNSAAEIERLTTGEAPKRPEIEADNAKQRVVSEADKGRPNDKSTADVKGDDKALTSGSDQDDVEGEDGLTPRQKREFSAQMLKSIGKKHREKLEAEEFAADQYNQRRLAEQRAENLERQLAELRTQQQTKPVEAPKKPERADFETDDAYQDALVDFRVKETLAREKRESEERAAQERQQQVIQAATDRLKKAAELVSDFEEVTGAVDLKVPGHIAGYMQESEMFAELGYHFAKHPDIMERLAKLSPAKALVEVGKIESTLQPFAKGDAAKADAKASNGQEPSSKTESAPQTAANGKGAGPSPETESGRQTASPSQKSRAPVIRPLGSDSVSQVEKDPGEMSTREVIEKWKRDNPRTNLGLRRRH